MDPTLVLRIAVLPLLVLAAGAQSPPQPQPPQQARGARVELARTWQHMKARHDADRDGRITLADTVASASASGASIVIATAC